MRGEYAVNIGPTERRKRRLLALAMMIVGVGALIVFVVTDLYRLWRIALFVPFWVAALGWFQAREHT